MQDANEKTFLFNGEQVEYYPEDREVVCRHRVDVDFNILTALKGWVGLAPIGGRVPFILLLFDFLLFDFDFDFDVYFKEKI